MKVCKKLSPCQFDGSKNNSAAKGLTVTILDTIQNNAK